jgi:DNA (cytosine-5)-methyltransferase 1
MKVGSLFRGIGGFDLGFERAGMEIAWASEIDKWCNGVALRHWPDQKIIKDVKDVSRRTAEPVDLICGGFPCQDLSVAGRGAGLGGERSGLWYEFARVLEELRPRWCVIENVPGLLSNWSGPKPPSDLQEGEEWKTEEESSMAIVLQGLSQLGYWWAYRVLDAQYFGVAQRRRRVFIVGCLTKGSAAKVLFEPESGERDTPPSREKREETPRSSETGAGIYQWASGGGDDIKDTAQALRSGAEYNYQITITKALSTRTGQRLDPTAESFAIDVRNLRKQPDEISGTLQAKKTGGHNLNYQNPVLQMVWEMSHANEAVRESGDIVPTLQRRMGTGGNQVPLVGVRRLTPLECERLQGFPDGWTEGESDTQRYKMLGNAVAVPIAEWIGKRIMANK